MRDEWAMTEEEKMQERRQIRERFGKNIGCSEESTDDSGGMNSRKRLWLRDHWKVTGLFRLPLPQVRTRSNYHIHSPDTALTGTVTPLPLMSHTQPTLDEPH
jgi:hypothetical protein